MLGIAISYLMMQCHKSVALKSDRDSNPHVGGKLAAILRTVNGLSMTSVRYIVSSLNSNDKALIHVL